jgi:putative transposase
MDIYHVLNRGVEKRDIVLSDDDRMRFVRSLYIFNDKKSAPNSVTQVQKWNSDHKRDCLVHIHSWCLMNNHYHLLLSPINDEVENISLFMKKVNMGYAKFFNEKYNRSGYLWQGKYKKILISNDAHFEYIPYYVHLNPLDYTNYEWRKGGIASSNVKSIIKLLGDYRWSSYLDYNDKKNFPSVIYTELFRKVLGSSEHQQAQINLIIKDNSASHESQSNILET